MGVRRLVCRRWNMQMIETGFASHRRTDKKRIGTSVDVSKTAPALYWSADLRESTVVAHRDYKADALVISLNAADPWQDEEHPLRKPKRAISGLKKG